MIITPARFKKIGETLFGRRKWYPTMADHIGCDRTLIWQIATGRTNCSVEIREKLQLLLRARGEEMLRMADELDSEMPPIKNRSMLDLLNDLWTRSTGLSAIRS